MDLFFLALADTDFTTCLGAPPMNLFSFPFLFASFLHLFLLGVSNPLTILLFGAPLQFLVLARR